MSHDPLLGRVEIGAMSHKDKKWVEQLPLIEVEQAYEEHRDSGQHSVQILRIWLLVTAFPFIAAGAVVLRPPDGDSGPFLDSFWLIHIPQGLRPFFVFSGILGLMLVLHHSATDVHRHICKSVMNSYRALMLSAMRSSFDKLDWEHPASIERNVSRTIRALSFTWLFAGSGGFISAGLFFIGLGQLGWWAFAFAPLGSLVAVLLLRHRLHVG